MQLNGRTFFLPISWKYFSNLLQIETDLPQIKTALLQIEIQPWTQSQFAAGRSRLVVGWKNNKGGAKRGACAESRNHLLKITFMHNFPALIIKADWTPNGLM